MYSCLTVLPAVSDPRKVESNPGKHESCPIRVIFREDARVERCNGQLFGLLIAAGPVEQPHRFGDQEPALSVIGGRGAVSSGVKGLSLVQFEQRNDPAGLGLVITEDGRQLDELVE
jgi:hypothetical protein